MVFLTGVTFALTKQWEAWMWGIQGTRKQSTFELRHHVRQVVLQFGISGKLKAHVIVGDSGECLWRIDAPLVQDAVDAKRWREVKRKWVSQAAHS